MFKELVELQKSGKISKKELAERVAALRLPAPLAFVSRYITYVVVGSMWIGAFVAAGAVLKEAFQNQSWVQYALLGLVPIAFLLTFVLIGVFWAQISKAGIIEGKFPRIPEHPIYALRRIYGAAWTQVYYFKPLYAVCLAVPALKWLLFRGYGYKGDLGVTIYPDTWIRDLPLLRALDSRCYLANRSTIGTNMCINDGSIIVGPISLGPSTMIGHLSMIGLGTRISGHSEVGVKAALGLRVSIEKAAEVKPGAEVNHGTLVHEKAIVGTSAVVGTRSVIGPGVEIKPGACIPPGAIIQTQEEADRYFSSENQGLSKHRDSLVALIKEQLNHGPSFGTGQRG